MEGEKAYYLKALENDQKQAETEGNQLLKEGNFTR
jgi:hypothetical protein